MRPDMHKVVIERPRWNPGPGKQGRRANLPDELLPKFEGTRRAHLHRKGLTDLLGPLKRWLQSQVGRPWNDVYSEACAVIKPDSIIRMHVKTHLLEFLERHTFTYCGKVCVHDSQTRGPVPLFGSRWRSVFFVHPESGLLLETPQISKAERRANHPKPKPTMRWTDRGLALQQIRGLWYECRFRVVPVDVEFKVYDHAMERVVCRADLPRWHNSYVHCFGKRQLSRRELKRYQLRNTPLLGAQSSVGCRYCRLTTALRRIELRAPVTYAVSKNEPNHTLLYGLGGGQCGSIIEQAGARDGDLGERGA